MPVPRRCRFYLSESKIIPARHLLLALLIREALAPFTGHPYDFEVWTRLGVYMQTLGNPYTGLPYYPGISFAPTPLIGSISYPPLPAFIFALTYRLYLLLGEPSRFVYYFLLKQPIVFSDLGIAILIARILLFERRQNVARVASMIWLYLPFGVIVSSIWGALDPVALFLILAAVYSLLKSRITVSACLLGLAIFMKTMPIVVLPVVLLQRSLGFNQRARYSGISIGIPALGTLGSVFLLNWGTAGILTNFYFQVDIPSIGAMSVLGEALNKIHAPVMATVAAGALWLPALLVSYVWISRKRLSVLQGTMVSILVFGISRPFLPEQWALYPTALLLTMIDKDNLQHLFAVVSVATIFLVVNNGLPVRFLAPLSVNYFYWDIFQSNFPPYVGARSIVLLVASGLFFAEALQIILAKESFIYRAIAKIFTKLGLEIPTQLHRWFEVTLDPSRT